MFYKKLLCNEASIYVVCSSYAVCAGAMPEPCCDIALFVIAGFDRHAERNQRPVSGKFSSYRMLRMNSPIYCCMCRLTLLPLSV